MIRQARLEGQPGSCQIPLACGFIDVARLAESLLVSTARGVGLNMVDNGLIYIGEHVGAQRTFAALACADFSLLRLRQITSLTAQVGANDGVEPCAEGLTSVFSEPLG